MTIETMDLSMVSSSIRSLVESEYVDGVMTREQQIAETAAAIEAQYMAESDGLDYDEPDEYDAQYWQDLRALEIESGLS